MLEAERRMVLLYRGDNAQHLMVTNTATYCGIEAGLSAYTFRGYFNGKDECPPNMCFECLVKSYAQK